MSALLIRLQNRLRPREGWAPYLLVLLAALCPPAALIDANRNLDAVALLVPAALAVPFGLTLARSRLSAGRAMALGGLVGGCLAVVAAGRLLPPPSLLWAEFTYAAGWLGAWQRGTIRYPLPFSSAAGFVWQRLDALGTRLGWWAQSVIRGGEAQDRIVLLLLACALAWAFGCLATWQIYRRRSALGGLLPGGAAVATTAFFAGGLALLYLMVYLFCTLWLMAICHFWSRRDHWQQTGTDYPGELGLELVFVLSPALALLLLLAALFPSIHPRQVRDAFWELMDGPWSAVERASERLFGPFEPGGHPGQGAAGSLPRAHLLGGGPELGETVVLYVATNDPPPPPPEADEDGALPAEHLRRYWRGTTLDTYTGRGWTNGPLEQHASLAAQPLGPLLPAGFELVQQFERVGVGEGVLYAVNAPLWIDQPVESWWRGPGDLVQVSSGTGLYLAVSRPPQPTIADLRQASSFVPSEIAGRYLALPETIPQRVLDLAELVVGPAETRYDQARAIETFLRAYTYTLDLPPPPADRDLVDHFLFEQQEGYCDYYASAMVVLARAVGIPARLATGYAQGTYDHQQQRWVVTEQDGHTWVEVYFDRIGWVEFEPTAGQPALVRAGGETLPRPQVPPLPLRQPRWWQRIPWLLLGMGVVMLLAVALVVSIWHPRRRRDLVVDRYSRLQDWGVRLKQPLRDGQTPLEYGRDLGSALGARGHGSRWRRARQAGLEAPQAVERLADAYVRTLYGPRPISDREGWQIRDLWARLRRQLWWLWLGHR